MQGRKLAVALLLAGVAVLGVLLFGSVQESHVFRLAAPVRKAAPAAGVVPENVQAAISGSTVSSLTTVKTSNLLQNPRYTGRDAEGRRWEVTATRADQHGTATAGDIVLEEVRATLELPAEGAGGQPGSQPDKKPAEMTLSAEAGTYSQISNTLDLRGNVVLTGYGFTLTAPQTVADMNSRTAVAQGGVRIRGSTGGNAGGSTEENRGGQGRGWNLDVTAPVANVGQGGGVMRLTGGVRGKLVPQGRENP